MNDVFLVAGGEGFIGRNIISKFRERRGEAYSLDIVGKPDYKISITNRKKLGNINRNLTAFFISPSLSTIPYVRYFPTSIAMLYILITLTCAAASQIMLQHFFREEINHLSLINKAKCKKKIS